MTLIAWNAFIQVSPVVMILYGSGAEPQDCTNGYFGIKSAWNGVASDANLVALSANYQAGLGARQPAKMYCWPECNNTLVERFVNLAGYRTAAFKQRTDWRGIQKSAYCRIRLNVHACLQIGFEPASATFNPPSIFMQAGKCILQ
jgi:hypothetical protein